MKSARCVTIITWLLFLFVFSFATQSRAEVQAGDVIDRTNWMKAEGLLPASVLDWVRKGDFILHIEDLQVKPLEFFPPDSLRSRKDNIGKYDLDKEGGIVDRKTGRPPDFIAGLPFPVIEPADPEAAEKIIYNNQFMPYLMGNTRFTAFVKWVGRSGFEREVELEGRIAPLTGCPGAEGLSNPGKMEKYSILIARKPYDLEGIAAMLWRSTLPTVADTTFSYNPSIRRVRRMTPANRSDIFLGSDLCMDDANGYDGKVSAIEWRLLGKQEALIPFLDPAPFPLVQDKRGVWKTTKDVKPVIHGYEQEEWTGAPWAPVNIVWARRPVYVIEMKPKDPFYNYGTNTLWVDAETWAVNYKVIRDRSGAYWKTLFICIGFLESADKQMRWVPNVEQVTVDERADHATITEITGKRIPVTFFAEMDLNHFSLAGFQKFCK